MLFAWIREAQFFAIARVAWAESDGNLTGPAFACT